MNRTANVSDCGRFRYRLAREWRTTLPRLLFLMLNPSTADGERDDATIRRCIGFAESHAFGSIEVVNLFAFRATRPADLRRAGYPVGPDNDLHIAEAASAGAAVCLAWGANVGDHERPQIVLPMLRSLGVNPMCLAITRGGHPAHPLMLAGVCRLVPFTPEAIQAAISRGPEA